ncbi:MAG TPA: ABC transporter ATP-binding protein [Cytophagaceae bacterium]|jgi:ABC-2 type transport system ATP-binding protein
MSKAIVSIRNVHKRFKNTYAVRGIDCDIGYGEYVALLGPNGAGKTTLIEMIEGLQAPDEGEIKILDKSWKNSERELHSSIGLSLQETKFIDKLTVEETARLFASFYHLKKERIEEILDQVNLQEKRKAYVVSLSGGQRQRLALGIALLNRPKVLLLDEPTTGLDPTARRDIWMILENLKKQEGTSMILTTHYMEEAEFLCDRIIIMDQGKFIAEGTLGELTAAYGEGDVISFKLSTSIDETLLSNILNGKKLILENKNTSGRMMVGNIADTLPRFLQIIQQQNISLEELECRKMTLEDLFLNLTGRSLT